MTFTRLFLVTLLCGLLGSVCAQDYGDALTKSILFYEGQRSGKLPSSQRLIWRRNSALNDGSDVKMDLVGGYYDAGDNVKFNFPMAFTVTMLAWSAVEYEDDLGSEADHAREAIRWGTDYFLKATSVDGVVAAQVGDPISDHNCWMRPEDMDTLRTTYLVNTTHPGSEVSAEIAAALAASSIVFKNVDVAYSKTLEARAIKVFEFADKYRGSYADSVGQGVCPFYCDFNGYMDELVWGASWLYAATGSESYLDYVNSNTNAMPVTITRMFDGQLSVANAGAEFGWDAKQAGINVFMSKYVVPSSPSQTNTFYSNADEFVCSVLPDSPTRSVTYSKGGLIFKPGGSNMQHTTCLSFLLLTYARQLTKSKRQVECGNVVGTPEKLIEIARGQVNYILGKNPLSLSYMVGYGNKFPERIHHRGSSLPSIAAHPAKIACKDGTPFYQTSDSNQNQLTGAIPGGPADDDSFPDNRQNATQAEPTTYINAPLIGLLAYFKGK
uniref:Endoglucanase n=1 Tax=Kalanchoe fedtschenkoi TaxID=63787 RepID=A0A7N0UTG0_KALFE